MTYGTFNKMTLNVMCLNDYLSNIEKNYYIKEELGTYYIEESDNRDPEAVPDVNKNEKRVITYTFKPKS